jgi:ATP-dependent DNA helicase RecG
MAERSLATELQYLKGVGPRNAAALAKAGLLTVGDILFHFPRRYEDRRHLPPIGRVQPGQWVTVRGQLVHFESRPLRRGMVVLKAVIRDGTGRIALTWFNQPWIRTAFEHHEGDVLAYGNVKETPKGYELASPEWELIRPDDDPEEFARIVPVYRLTEGLSQKVVRRAAKSAVEGYIDAVVDALPDAFRRRYGLQRAAWSLRQIHWPESEDDKLKARKRLVFEEFFLHQVALAHSRAQVQQELGIAFPIDRLIAGEVSDLFASAAKKRRPSLTGRTASTAVAELPDVSPHLFVEEQRAIYDVGPLWDQIQSMLPFDLTGAQRRVIEEIWSDMKRPYPMNRLVQGDVGSGKTAVAACCMLAAVRSGYQAAIMAPTELLAEQHAANLRRLFEPVGIEVDLLVGKLTPTQKKRAAQRTESGDVHIAVGTHALIQEGVNFHRLGLAIIDEQHRFGVLQRKALRDKGLGNPDVLVMTATPIPRSLTMAVYGDLDLSVIDELPPGRRPVKTHWKLPFERDPVYQGVRKLIDEGRQAYVVCPLVSESEKMLAQAAEELYESLSGGVFYGLRMGLLHGQLKPKEKEAVMQAFREHRLDVLVSTTVIEVGVDVPNASVMVIEDATRFGLAQLHQLRGRVGRGSAQSYCILIADAKGDDGRVRMEVLRDTNDGFRIAEEDLRLRGPGEMAGTKQSGNLDFRLADLLQDSRMLEEARQAALEVIQEDPMLTAPEWAIVRELIREKRSDVAIVAVS